MVKRKMLLIILGIFVLGFLVAALTTNFLMLVASRVMLGIGISMFPIAFSIIRDKFPPEKFALGQAIFLPPLCLAVLL